MLFDRLWEGLDIDGGGFVEIVVEVEGWIDGNLVFDG